MAARTNWIVTPQKFLKPDQVQQLRANVEAERQRGLAKHDRYAVKGALVVELLLNTGLRVSEAAALVVGDLFLDRGAANVLVRRGKGCKTRLVAVSDRFAAYLAVFIAWKLNVGESVEPEAPLVVSERGGHMTRSGLYRIWTDALKRAGLPSKGPHSGRHTFAVEVYRKTRDLRLTQRLLGHSSPLVTTVYANLLDDDVRKGVEAIWA